MRGAVPQLFDSAFTKQAADHLEQVETLRKAKGKGKKVFSRPPGEQAVQLTRDQTLPAAQGTMGLTPKKLK